MAGSPTASADLVRLLLGYAAQLGLDTEQLAAGAKLQSELLADREARVELDTYAELFDAVALASRDEDFGLHLGEAVSRVGTGHVLSAVMMNCETVAQALDKLTRYHGLVTDGVTPVLERRDGATAVVLAARLNDGLGRHESEASLSSFALVLRTITAGRVRPGAVHFAHDRPSRTAEHERIFGCPLVFGAERSELLIGEGDMRRSMPMSDPPLLVALERFAQERVARMATLKSWSSRIRDSVSRALARGERPSLAASAKALGVSRRSLQSRLDEEQTSFKLILDEVRRDLAVGYLERADMSLSDIAFLLGYSEQSGFNHAFRRWTGSTPRAYRSRQGR